MKNYLLARWNEQSTRRALIWLAGAIVIAFWSPEQAKAATSIVMAVAGLYGAGTPDK